MRPSRDTKPTTIRKPSDDFVTLRPVVCTICGSCDVTSCSLFCVCICATSALASLVKVSVTVAMPDDVEVDVMWSRLSMPVRPCSMTLVTEFSTVCASAPG